MEHSKHLDEFEEDPELNADWDDDAFGDEELGFDALDAEDEEYDGEEDPDGEMGDLFEERRRATPDD
jgi:hypothetical protein